jgi:hypothetical protein
MHYQQEEGFVVQRELAAARQAETAVLYLGAKALGASGVAGVDLETIGVLRDLLRRARNGEIHGVIISALMPASDEVQISLTGGARVSRFVSLGVLTETESIARQYFDGG